MMMILYCIYLSTLLALGELRSIYRRSACNTHVMQELINFVAVFICVCEGFII